jgi:hypothetical protein
MAKIRLADSSGNVELTYIVEDVDRHGNARFYVKRRGHRNIRMRSPPGSQAFLDEYRGAIAGAGHCHPNFAAPSQLAARLCTLSTTAATAMTKPAVVISRSHAMKRPSGSRPRRGRPWLGSVSSMTSRLFITIDILSDATPEGGDAHREGYSPIKIRGGFDRRGIKRRTFTPSL